MLSTNIKLSPNLCHPTYIIPQTARGLTWLIVRYRELSISMEEFRVLGPFLKASDSIFISFMRESGLKSNRNPLTTLLQGMDTLLLHIRKTSFSSVECPSTRKSWKTVVSIQTVLLTRLLRTTGGWSRQLAWTQKPEKTTQQQSTDDTIWFMGVSMNPKS